MYIRYRSSTITATVWKSQVCSEAGYWCRMLRTKSALQMANKPEIGSAYRQFNQLWIESYWGKLSSWIMCEYKIGWTTHCVLNGLAWHECFNRWINQCKIDLRICRLVSSAPFYLRFLHFIIILSNTNTCNATIT